MQLRLRAMSPNPATRRPGDFVGSKRSAPAGTADQSGEGGRMDLSPTWVALQPRDMQRARARRARQADEGGARTVGRELEEEAA